MECEGSAIWQQCAQRVHIFFPGSMRTPLVLMGWMRRAQGPGSLAAAAADRRLGDASSPRLSLATLLTGSCGKLQRLQLRLPTRTVKTKQKKKHHTQTPMLLRACFDVWICVLQGYKKEKNLSLGSKNKVVSIKQTRTKNIFLFRVFDVRRCRDCKT